MTLYSIDGGRNPAEWKTGPDSGEMFRGFPVLGKVAIEDPGRREALISAFNKGIEPGDGALPDCFWPRHAIRADRGGDTTDYLICFQCRQFAIYRGEERSSAPIDRSPLPAFNEELKRAGVPLATAGLKGSE